MKLATIILMTLIFSLSAENSETKKGTEKPESAKEKTAVMTDEVKAIFKKAAKAMKAENITELKNMEQTATLIMPKMNLKGSVTAKVTDDCIYINSMFAGMQETKAYNGKAAWSNNLVTGFRTIEGAEKISLISETLQYAFHYDKFYDEIKLAGKEKFNNKMCYKLELIKKGIDISYEFIDTETFHTAGSIENVVTPQGKMKATTFINKWKVHKKGFKYPSEMVQSTGPVSININITDIKVDTDIDSKIFNPPSN